MGQFLNNKEPYDKYRTVTKGPYFVDKTEHAGRIDTGICSRNSSFFCITQTKAFWEDGYGEYDRVLFLKISEGGSCIFDDLYISEVSKHYKEQAGQA